MYTSTYTLCIVYRMIRDTWRLPPRAIRRVRNLVLPRFLEASSDVACLSRTRQQRHQHTHTHEYYYYYYYYYS